MIVYVQLKLYSLFTVNANKKSFSFCANIAINLQ